MHESPGGIDWWQASDGQWYPPELHPDHRDAVPPPVPAYPDPNAPVIASKPKNGALPRFSDIVPLATRTLGKYNALDSKLITMPDGRDLELCVDGPSWGTPLVVHHGTPSAAVHWPALMTLADHLGLRLLQWSRPGYGRSDRQPTRTVADTAADTAAVLNALGYSSFLTIGWSGGGPHALACASILGHRCIGAAVVATQAPRDAEGLTWGYGMDEGAKALGDVARIGGDQLRQDLLNRWRALVNAGPAQLPIALGSMLTSVDATSLTAQLAGPLAEGLRTALSAGVDGWYDDCLAQARPWGFDIAEIVANLSVWQGGSDRIAPSLHGAWIADHARRGALRTLADCGHVSSLLLHLEPILGDLVSRAHEAVPVDAHRRGA